MKGSFFLINVANTKTLVSSSPMDEIEWFKNNRQIYIAYVCIYVVIWLYIYIYIYIYIYLYLVICIYIYMQIYQ